MTTQELPIEEISRPPESVQREVLYFLRSLVQQQEGSRRAATPTGLPVGEED